LVRALRLSCFAVAEASPFPVQAPIAACPFKDLPRLGDQKKRVSRGFSMLLRNREQKVSIPSRFHVCLQRTGFKGSAMTATNCHVPARDALEFLIGRAKTLSVRANSARRWRPNEPSPTASHPPGSRPSGATSSATRHNCSDAYDDGTCENDLPCDE
jgi:hypothetical protein